MTSNKNFKHRVRARAAKTGESYTAARRQVRPPGAASPKRLRLAVAQTELRQDALRAAELRAGGQEVRDLMRAAASMNARVVHFSEGAVCFPHKRIVMSDPGGWDKVDWTAWREELTGIARLARELRLWTVVGSAHQLTAPNRPYNSLYVISDAGQVVIRYDERMLSNTKITWMYAPGSIPVTFDVDGVRFGCLLGFDSHFPELFTEYERLDVDCVLLSTSGPGTPGGGSSFSTEAQAQATSNSYWVSLAMPTQYSSEAPSGLVAPTGQWLARCARDGRAAVVAADIDDSTEDVDIAVRKARPWRRTARSGVFGQHMVRDDPRSDDRRGF
jgi:predicted amidohydrolase